VSDRKLDNAWATQALGHVDGLSSTKSECVIEGVWGADFCAGEEIVQAEHGAAKFPASVVFSVL